MAGVAAALLVALGPPAAGAAPDATGWWTRTNVGPLVPVEVPTGVPEGGLYVAGDPDGRSGMSALRFSLAEGGLATTLSLPVESVAGVASVLVCRSGIGWTGEDGGSLDTAPADACDEGSVPGKVSDDGTTLTVDVSGLGEPGVLDVVLVPADRAVFRLVLGPPGEDALATSASPVAPAPVPEGAATVPDDAGGGTGEATFDSGFAAAPLDAVGGALPPGRLPALEPPALPDDVPLPQTPADLAPAPVAAPALVGGTDRVQVLFGLLFADVLLVWWWLLRREQRAPRSLLALAGAARAAAATEAPVRGVGRFARPRSGPAVGV